jgi:hypothetical protein
MTEMIPLELIKDNPHRDKKRNPIDMDKVVSLKESIGTTGFWKGIYGRRVGKFVEIAYGHNRVEAARAAGLKEIPVEIEELTDSDMLMRMTRENLRGELLVALEAVSAAVKAYGAGTVEFELSDPSTRKDTMRYAPSFVPGKVAGPPEGPRCYTADTLARFLGGVYVKAPRTGRDGARAQNSVQAALGILEMEERKVKGFSEKVLQTNNAGPDGKYFGAKRIIEIVSEVKQREVKVQERAEKSAEEIRLADKAARALQEKQRVREVKEKKEHDELLSKRVAAQVAENAAEVKRLQQVIKDKNEAAEVKAEADKAKMKELEAGLAAKKEAAKEQAKVDEYLPIRREADRIIHILERRDLAEDLKALSRRPLNLKDRQRVWEAIDGLAGWLNSWAAAQFNGPSGLVKANQKRKR